MVTMKKALVLAGGGTKGAYQAGAIRALCEMGMDDWDIVTGTSVGSMHAALVVQKDYDYLYGIYDRLKKEEIFNGTLPVNLGLEELIGERKEIGKTLLQVVRDKGVDISPLKKNIHALFDADKFFSSHTDFGCITATEKGHDGVYVTKDMMRVNPEKWILASCSAYPAFPAAEIDGQSYVDGGYFDNVPVDFALRLGADEAVVIDLSATPYHPHYLTRSNIRYLFPHSDPGDFLDFSKEKINHLITALRRLLLALLLLFPDPGLTARLRPEPLSDGPWAYLSGRCFCGPAVLLRFPRAPFLSLSSIPYLLSVIIIPRAQKRKRRFSAIYFSSRGVPV